MRAFFFASKPPQMSSLRASLAIGMASGLLAMTPYLTARLTPDEVFGGITASSPAIEPPASSPETPSDSVAVPLPFEESIRTPASPSQSPQNNTSDGAGSEATSSATDAVPSTLFMNSWFAPSHSTPQTMPSQAWIIAAVLATLIGATLAGYAIMVAVWRHNDQRTPSSSPSSHAEPS